MNKWLWLAVLTVIAITLAIGKAIVDVVDKPRESYETTDIGVDDKTIDAREFGEEPRTPPPDGVDDDDLLPRPATEVIVGRIRTGESTIERPLGVDDGQAFLDRSHLQMLLVDRSATNADLIRSLDTVFAAYLNFARPEKPTSRSLVEQHIYARDLERIQKSESSHAKKVEKLLFKAMALEQIDHAETNVRDDVCFRAATILGEIARRPLVVSDAKKRRDLTKKTTRLLDGMRKAKYEVGTARLDATFAAVARLNHEFGLEWLRDNFVHTKSRPHEVDRLIAAHKALVLFTRVPGKTRYAVTSEFIKIYLAPESAATHSDSQRHQTYKAFWDRVRPSAIRVVQHYAGNPVGADGRPLDTIEGFQDWFRDHKRRDDPVWSDE